MCNFKLFSIKNLRKYDKHVFIRRREELFEDVFFYKNLLDEVERLVELFRIKNVPAAVGIAFFMEQHTPANIGVLLSILNSGCHFVPLKKAEALQTNIAQELRGIGVHYFIVPEYIKNVETNCLLNFELLNETFWLYKLIETKHSAIALTLPPNMCYSMRTTGSTGAPKMVHVPYACIAPNVIALSARLSICASDIIYLCSPHTFDPFIIEFFLALHKGATLLLTSQEIRLIPQKLVHTLFPAKNTALQGVTILQITSSLFRRFGCNFIRENILTKGSSLKVLLLGGECFPSANEIRTWITDGKILRHKMICNIYGITELSCWSTIYHLNSIDIEHVPLGEPIDAETVVRIVDAQGKELLGSGQGELWLGSATRRCFIAEPSYNSEASTESTVCFRATGDLVRRNEKKKIYFISRLNNIIKRFGKLIGLDMIAHKMENLLIAHSILVVCLWLDEEQKLVSCLLHNTPVEQEKRKEIAAAINKSLPPDERPDRLLYYQELPLNSHGKIDRQALMQLCRNVLHANVRPLEIFELFLRDTLGVDLNNHSKISSIKRRKSCSTVSFTAAGGTSFHALSLSTEIGSLMLLPRDQRQFLEMLLNEQVSIGEIIDFLLNVCTAKNMLKTESLPLLNRNQSIFKFQWRVDFKKCVDSSIAKFDQRYICVGSHSNLLQTIDAESGTLIASITLPDRIECKVEILNNELAIVGCYNGSLYAFQPKTGKALWNVQLGGMIKAKPIVCLHDKSVIIGSYAEQHNVTCLQLEEGEAVIRWQIKVGTKGIFAGPIHLTDRCILICCLDGSYAAISVENGHINWLHKCNMPIFSTPVLLPNCTRFALAEVSGAVHICNANTGVRLVTFQADGNIFSSIITVESHANNEVRLLFGCHDHNLYCLQYADDSPATITLIFKTKLDSTIYAAPVILELALREKYVICCATRGQLALIKLADGTLLTLHDVPGEIFSTPTILNRRIYFGCRDNFLYCFLIESE